MTKKTRIFLIADKWEQKLQSKYGPCMSPLRSNKRAMHLMHRIEQLIAIAERK